MPVQAPPTRSARKVRASGVVQLTNTWPREAATRGWKSAGVRNVWLVNTPLALSAATARPSRSQATRVVHPLVNTSGWVLRFPAVANARDDQAPSALVAIRMSAASPLGPSLRSQARTAPPPGRRARLGAVSHR